jgi:hypothetical protein
MLVDSSVDCMDCGRHLVAGCWTGGVLSQTQMTKQELLHETCKVAGYSVVRSNDCEVLASYPKDKEPLIGGKPALLKIAEAFGFRCGIAPICHGLHSMACGVFCDEPLVDLYSDFRPQLPYADAGQG